MSLATLSDMGLMFCVFANKSHVSCFSNHVYNDALLVLYCLYRPLLIEHIASDISG